MKRFLVLGLAAAAVCIAIFGAAATPVPAETVTYEFPALPGAATACKWFDDNINDRSIDAIIRQTDLIYNRAPLTPGATVAISGTATTALGAQIDQFNVGRRLMCAGDAAFHAAVPEPTPSPPSF